MLSSWEDGSGWTIIWSLRGQSGIEKNLEDPSLEQAKSDTSFTSK